MTARVIVLLVLFIGALAAAPLVVDRYVLTVLTTLLWFAFTAQAWNVMMGFAGLLSLGHALYVGVGAYVAAGLFVHFGVSPWIGLWAAMACAAALGAFIGFLGVRFGVRGVHFALLTIAFAEVARIAFDHVSWLGGSAGFFIPLGNETSWEGLRLPAIPFYYLILGLTLGALGIARLLLHSRLGYRWLAVREDADAAQAVGIDLFRARIAAIVVSAALAALAGVFEAFYRSTLFPEQVFAMGRSIEIIMPAIVGGIGTLFGPILGALILTPLGEVLTWAIEATGVGLPGLKQLFYGVAIILIVAFRPEGVWPWLARRIGVRPRGGGEGP